MEIPGAARLAVQSGRASSVRARPALPGERGRSRARRSLSAGRCGREERPGGTKRKAEPRGMLSELCCAVRRGFAVVEPCVSVTVCDCVCVCLYPCAPVRTGGGGAPKQAAVFHHNLAAFKESTDGPPRAVWCGFGPDCPAGDAWAAAALSAGAGGSSWAGGPRCERPRGRRSFCRSFSPAQRAASQDFCHVGESLYSVALCFGFLVDFFFFFFLIHPF